MVRPANLERRPSRSSQHRNSSPQHRNSSSEDRNSDSQPQRASTPRKSTPSRRKSTPSRRKSTPSRRKSTPSRRKSAPKRRPTTTENRKKSDYYFVGNKKYKVFPNVLREIKRLQVTTELCIPKLPFSRLVREILMEHAAVSMKVERNALVALQEAAEIYLTQLFEDSNRCANHASRITVKPADMALALAIRGVIDPGNK